MQATPHLDLPYIMPAQAQKHVTHNDALDMVDALLQLAVVSRALSDPPATPEEGARHIVAAGAGGAWAGHDNSVAIWRDGGWRLFAPQPGWLAFVLDESALVSWTGTEWTSALHLPSTLENLEGLGVGTAPDAENPFAAKLNTALWAARSEAEGGTGDLRYTLNKEGAAHVLSLLFQSAWSGRAEIGLAGSDDLSIRVSDDGDHWTEAARFDRASGRASFPQSNFLTGFAVSLLADSGRFAGNAARSETVGSFVWPGYLALASGAVAAEAGKFINNNTDYGGSAGSLAAPVKDLIDQIRSADRRRYGVEFHIAEITMGSGNSGQITVGGTSYYLALLLGFGPRAPAMTFHVYVRALDAPVVWRHYSGQTFTINGESHNTHLVIAPEDEWVSVAVHDEQNPYATFGYNPTPLNLQAASAGDRFLIACPALMGGLTRIDPNIGIIAGVNRWLG